MNKEFCIRRFSNKKDSGFPHATIQRLIPNPELNEPFVCLLKIYHYHQPLLLTKTPRMDVCACPLLAGVRGWTELLLICQLFQIFCIVQYTNADILRPLLFVILSTFTSFSKNSAKKLDCTIICLRLRVTFSLVFREPETHGCFISKRVTSQEIVFPFRSITTVQVSPNCFVWR